MFVPSTFMTYRSTLAPIRVNNNCFPSGDQTADSAPTSPTCRRFRPSAFTTYRRDSKASARGAARIHAKGDLLTIGRPGWGHGGRVGPFGERLASSAIGVHYIEGAQFGHERDPLAIGGKGRVNRALPADGQLGAARGRRR